ncbi:RcnB family protein [Phenylobacterium montanum]|uniref:RcnB family protein n=1 Tax=Phenylobacterium montanum TaxID=2823693 RepID=A0A975IWW1_9CAUL|nr:RcnB family protein [Caulobacter sp. S6]QUD89999.1 RcnB family protein [Caulobacter sp. S6]
MKTLLAATAALALLGGTSAFAQNDYHQGGHNEGVPHGEARGGPPGQGGGGYRQGGYQSAPQAARPQAAPQYAPQQYGGQRYGGEQGGYRQNPQYARPQNAPQYGGQRYDGQRHEGDRGEGYRGEGNRGAPGWQGHPEGRGPRPNWGAPMAEGGRAPRYDRHYYPRVVDLGSRYHWRGDWYPQRGFYYHRWVYGEFLPFGWFARDYWVDDYWDYGLPPPPWGYTWVRVGGDVLLINIANGFVAESIYGAFY